MRNINDLLISAYVASRVRQCRRVARVLDLGCGRAPYRDVYVGVASSVVLADCHRSRPSSDPYVTLEAEQLPFGNGSFDLVLVTEVLEHLKRPRAAAAEIARVLAPNGKAIITVPFLYPLHEIPRDYSRFTPWGLLELFSGHLEPLEILPRGGIGAVIADMCTTLTYYATESSRRAIGLAPRAGPNFSLLSQAYARYWCARQLPPAVRRWDGLNKPSVPERHTLGYLSIFAKSA